jgi:glycosyltransferase involved in cell wall biosynthesis
MRIAVWHNLPSGGGKRALYDHVKGLTERGHYVESWRPPLFDDDYLPLSNLIKETVTPLSLNSFKPKTRFGRAVAPYRDLKNHLDAMDEHCLRCADEINRGEFDVLFAGSCYYSRTSPVAKYVNLPSVLYLQEPNRSLFEAFPDPPWALSREIRQFRWTLANTKNFIHDMVKIRKMRTQVCDEIENAKHFDLILVNSLFSRESVLRSYGLESKVCYLGIDTNKFRPVTESKLPFLVGVGAIYHGKRIDRSIRAISKVKQTLRPKLIWIGNVADEAYRIELESLAESLQVEIEFHIRATDEKTIELLSVASAMIYNPFLEPFGLAPLEANACGTAIIGLAEGGLRESITHGVNGYLVSDEDPIKFAEIITKFVGNAAFAKSMGTRARQHVVENWNHALSIDRVENYLANCVRG